MFLYISTQERNQGANVGQYQYGARTELFSASYHIRLCFQERSPGSHSPSQAPLLDSAISDEKTSPIYEFRRKAERIPLPK